MRNHHTISPLLVLLFLSMMLPLFALHCSKEKEVSRQQAAPPSLDAAKRPVLSIGFTMRTLSQKGYEGWREFIHDFVVVYTPPDSALMERVPAIAERIRQVTIENAYRLGVSLPRPFHFYLYNNTTEIEERTDCKNTCVDGNTVHYMLFTPLGEPIVVRLLRDFDANGNPTKAFYEGLVTFLNYSGDNYAEMAYIDYFNGKLTSLADLLDNKKYAVLDSATRVVAAASLVSCLVDQPYSPEKFLTLYRSDASAAKALKEIYGKTIDDIEKEWYQYLQAKGGLKLEQ